MLGLFRKTTGIVVITLLFTGLFFSAFEVKPTESSNSTTIYVDPSECIVNANDVSVGDKFKVTIWVSNVENLYAWQVYMYYNTSILQVSDWFVPSGDPEFVFYGKTILLVEDEDGYIAIGASLVGSEEPFSGSGKLVTIEFEILAVPSPSETYSSVLNINNENTQLFDASLNIIPALKEDGYYEIKWFLHELALSLNAPGYVATGTLNILNVTVRNAGLNNETDVKLFLLINNTVVKSEIIPQLLSGETYVTSYAWTPASRGTYNITAYVPPVLDEEYTKNNIVTRYVTAFWNGTVYIKADGTIYPDFAPVITHDNITYVLVDNITCSALADGIVVERDNIVIDGGGHFLKGCEAGSGVILHGRSNVTIRNLKIKMFDDGILINSSIYCNIIENEIVDNYRGIGILNSYYVNISRNELVSNKNEGIYIDSNYINIIGNNLTINQRGIVLVNSNNNTISRNYMEHNTNGGIILEFSIDNFITENIFVNDGLVVWGYVHGNLIEGNIVNGKPLVYLENVSNYHLVGDVGQVILVKCSNILVENLNLSNTTVGVELLETSNCKIVNSSITSNYYGVFISNFSFNNTIFKNNLTANEEGIYLIESYNNNISENKIIDNSYGLHLIGSSNNSIFKNNLTDNNFNGILLEHSNNNLILENNIAANTLSGIEFWGSSNNTITQNNLTNNQVGIGLAFCSNNNIIVRNEISSNQVGIILFDSAENIITRNIISNNFDTGISASLSFGTIIKENEVYYNGLGIDIQGPCNDTKIFHNNFIENDIQAYVSDSYVIWDNGYPSGGNYWSDYNGTDYYSGPYQNETGSDGIGDTPYMIDTNNIDHYPLMAPYVPSETIHDIAIMHISLSKTIVGQGYSMNINVTIANKGNFTETLNLTVYANTTIVETKEIILGSGTSVTLSLIWNTSGFVKGNYTIWAFAWPVEDETNTADNTFMGGVVFVGVPCDLTGPTPGVPDGICNMRDIGYICSKFMTTPSNPNWNPNADITGPTGVPDNIVNMRDIGEACKNFMKTDP